MKKKTRKNPVVIGFAEQIQAVSQRTKQIATAICRITGVFAWVFMAYGLQAQSLSTDDFSGTYCPGASFNVNYTASGDFGSNTFKAYVSKDGFQSSVEIGSISVSGMQSNGMISVTIPYTLSGASNYRIRIISTVGPIYGNFDDNGTNLTITALTVTASNPSASIYCVGDPISVAFTTSCALASGNTFTLQLSDKTGSFTSPTTIGSSITGTTGATITGNIPAVPYGSAYKVRVVSSNPNTNVTWTANTTALKIANAKLSNLKSVGSTFCPGESMSLAYTFASNEELNPGNITSVEMSDASGSFASPTVVGSLGSTATSGTINAIIPYVVTGGTGYRFRIVSSNAATIGCLEYGPYSITKVRDFTDPLSNYVCAGGTLSLSTDAGFTSYAWQKVSAPPFSLINIGSTSTTSIAKNGSNVYIGTAKGLYVSSDGGSTFSKNSQIRDTFINKIFVNGAKVYAATNNGIFYSSDSGVYFNTNFTSGTNGLPIPNISTMATNADGTIIYAGTTSGLSRSTNSGTSFAATSIVQPVSGIFVSGSIVYVTTGTGLQISYDDGATFPVFIGSGFGLLPSANATSIFVKDGIIYVGTDSGLSVSTNGGASWTNYNATNNGLAGNKVNSIAVANNLIYLGTDKGFSVGNLGGDGFATITSGLAHSSISGVVAEATSSTVNNVYLVIIGSGFATNTFTLSNLGVSTSSYTQSISPSDSRSSFQVQVEKNGCYLTSNQAQVADIPPDFTSVSSVTPTKCAGVSGRIILSGLIPNTQYQLLYTGPYQGIPKSGDTVTITAQGTDTIFLLGPGSYTNIYMKSLVKGTGQTDGCTNTAASIVINDGPQPTAVTANTVSPICSGQNLSISLTSTLAANEVYRWYTDAGGTILASPDITTGNTFTLTNLPISSGTLYVRKRNNNTQCNGDLLAINYTVNKAVQISSSVASQPSSATATDGSLIIAITSSSNPSGAYTLSYNKVVNSVSTPQTVSGLTLASFPYTLSNLSVGNYTNITVTADNGCPSNVIASTALVGLPSPTAIGGATLQSQNCGIIGVDGGYFQKVELPYAASSNWITENAGAIAVGRIRQSIYNSAAKNETVEMRGYVKFDLSSIPTNATIDKVELRPRSMFGGFQTVGDVTISYAVGDLKFDVTQVSATNYSPYVGYSDQVFDDLYDPKYNDFVIGANATGALTDLGAQAVNDVQIRLANDKIFELGLALSGTDTILPLTQFNGIVFAPSSYQKLCITYHLNDYGDLPEPKYATNAEGGLVGPSHRVDLLDVNPDVNTTLLRPALYIGATAPDAEADGQVNDNASGTADEDLTTASFSGKLIAGESVTLTVPVTNNIPQPAKLSVFIDWNGDGIFNNTSERYDQDVLPATQVSASSTPIPYTNSYAFNLTVPQLDNSYAVGVRVRLSTGTGLDAYGPAPNGEVEDFLMDVLGLDYGDLPDPTAGLGIDNYQTRRADNGARHAVPTTVLVFLGNTVDTETDAVPSALADGDDKNNINNNDEDGIRFLTSPMVPGQPVTIEYTATNNSSTAAKLYLYADFNNDGVNSMEDAPVVFTSGNAVVAANAGNVTRQLTFLLPQNAVYGGDKAIFRFRFTTDVDPLPYGLAQDGEVEDYLSSDFQLTDWADLPEPRYITDATGGIQGPSHRIRYIDVDPTAGLNYQNTLFIGATPPDAEKDGKPSHLATGDDLSYQDDEDLSYLNFLNPTTNQPFPLVADEPIRLRIPVVNNSPDNPATLWAFMDWNGDGDFEDEGEKISQAVATNYSGDIDFDFTIPKVAKSDSIGIRIRLTGGVGIDAYGPAPDGEVEDFVLEILTLDYGDLPDATTGIGNNDYQTLRSRNGARHGIPVVPLVVMGTAVDSEVDGQPSAKSNGDDQNPQVGQDDEDGIVFLTPLVPGYTSQVAFTGRNQSNVDATLYVYTDWTNDGVLDLATTYTLAANSTASAQSISFYVPANATFEGGKAFFRFRLTTDPDFNAAPSANGVAIDGEVEDYYVPLFKLGNLVWEDRNNNGFQDAEEIQLGIQNVRVVMRFGGIDPSSVNYDEVTQNTLADPNTLTPLGAGVDLIPDYVIDTFTNSKGLYGFTGMIEGNYQIIAVDTFGLTPTRFDWITNGTEEDHDSDGKPLKNSWEYATGERRQSKSQQIKILESQIGILETGILDQTSSQLLDPNQLDGFPDNKVEHRIDFGYIGLDLGDLAESGNDPSVNNFVTSENGTKPEGPKHIVTPDLRLGKYQDVEWQGQADQDAGEEFLPGADAGGDDPIADFSNYPGSVHDPSQSRHWPFHVADDHDDEDGIKFLSPLVAGYDAVLSVKYSAKINFNGPDAYLHAWMDWNGDGNFDDGAGNADPDEHILFSMLDGKPTILEANTQAVRLEMSYLTSANDSITLTFKVPANVKYNKGNILSRFRISFDPQLGPNGILPANLNFPDPQPGAESSSVPGGIIPYGEVEDYFIALAKVSSIAWQDQNYNGKRDEGEATFQGQPVKLEFAGLDGIFGTSDDFTYLDTTDTNGKFVFCGLIGSNIYDPSGLDTAVYRLIVNVPPNTVPAFGLPAADACGPLDFANSDGSTANADPGITQTVFSISNPNGQCATGGTGSGGGDFPETQTNGTINFGFSAFDYGDLPVQGTNYLTLRDSLSVAFNNRFGPRHIIQSRLYLGSGVDGERDGQPDADAGSKSGGDDGVAGRFRKGTGSDDETGIRLLTPLIPGEMAYLQVSYTSQDTIPTGGNTNRDAFLRSFIDFNGDGDLDDLSDIVDYSLIAPGIAGPFSPTTDNVQLAGGTNQIQVLAFRVPVSAIYRNGTAYMRHRLSWNSTPLGPNNNPFHLNTAPFVDTTLTYPQGEVEDYAIPLAKIGNLAWFDHDVFGDQDDNEEVVDSLEMVLVYGGVDPSTGTFDEVGYQRSIQSAGNVADIVYNLSIVPSGNATTAPSANDSPGHIERTASAPAQDSGLYSFKGLIPGTYYLIPKKYLLSDSTSFTNAWPKHRILTISDNPGVDDQHDNDGMPGALFTLNDGNSKDPEVAVAAQPINETGKQDTADASRMNALMPGYGVFPDSLYNQTIDLGWVDEPNVEAKLDVVGVYFPTSKICGNFNVILHFCVKNPKEVPLDSLQAFLNLKNAYGNALYAGTKLKVSIADSAYINGPAYGKRKKSQAGAKAQLVLNPNYDGDLDTRLLLPSSENANFALKGDSAVCIRIEFEIDPTQTQNYPWMSQGSVTARAVGFNKQTGAKRPLIDNRFFHPRFGKSIAVFDNSDSTVQNDECWYKTKWNSGIKDVTVALNSSCESTFSANVFVPNFDQNCGFEQLTEGSFYAVIIQDKWTKETIWTSDDPSPFDAKKYLDRKLTYTVISVANSCAEISGDFFLVDKIAPVVQCATNTDRKVVGNTPTGTYTFVCTDIDSILNVKRSWSNPNYPYYTGIAVAKDSCGQAWLDNVKDELEVLADCDASANAGFVYARIRRIFTFTDDKDNKTTCTQIISFRRPRIVLPECKVEIPNNLAGASKDLIPADLIKAPFNLAESVPYYFNGAGKRIYLTGRDYCGIAVNYTDEIVFKTGECGRKIIRHWTLLDWCYGVINNQASYPVYHLVPNADADCYSSIAWDPSLHMLTWEQHLIVGDNGTPIVSIPDYDRDGVQGSGYQGGERDRPEDDKLSTYDAGDVLTISTGPMECKGSYLFTRKDLDIIEQSKWCFDLQVVQRSPILDPFKRPTGSYEWKTDPGVTVKGDCDKGYAISGIPMLGNWFLRLRVYDVCNKDTLIYYPIRAVDKIAPVMKSDNKLILSLNNGGLGFVSAEQFDEGSWDNCTRLEWKRLRRPVSNLVNANFIGIRGVVDANENGKIDAYSSTTTSPQDYVDVNRNRQADPEEYFKIDATTSLLMTPLMDSVPFFCADRGSVMLELWGNDNAGNRSYSWGNVLIEDKTIPVCSAPWTISVSCDDKSLYFIDSKVASAKAFGDVLITSGNLCADFDTAYSVIKKLKCGAGTIERIWTLTKQTSKGSVAVTCKQIIRVLPLREYNIYFPKDVDQRDCKTPVIDTAFTTELGCDILAVNVTDRLYDASNDECYKIFRTYTVIDWCAYDDNCGDPTSDGIVYVVDRSYSNYGQTPIYVLVRDADQDQREEFYLSLNDTPKEGNLSDSKVGTDNDEAFVPAYCENAFSDNPYGLPVGEFYHAFQYTQIIKVYDEVKPVVTGDQAKFCIREGGDCLADIKMIVKGTDNCTDQVTLETNLLAIAPFQTRDAGSMIAYSTSRWSTKVLAGGQFEINVSNLLQGKHDLIVVVRDECGNLSEPTRIPFTVEDCKGPVPICINGLSTNLTPDGNGGGIITVWATDLIASKIFDCNGQGPETNGNGKLVTKYSINRVGSPASENQTSLVFNCKEAGKIVLVELHAWDNAGNHDFCVSFVEVQDNRKVCETGNANLGSIIGVVTTDQFVPLVGVAIDMNGASTLKQTTANSGVFAFNGLTKGADFSLSAQLDKDHVNGVSTFDLVLIQKHILGTKLIDNPYRQIAADVNNSKSITTLDMIQIRKLILQVDDKFKSVPSWKFVDAAYRFPDASNPFGAEYPEVINVNNLNGNVKADFVAIKMGDVNGNASTVNGIAAAEIRSNRHLLLTAEEQAMQADGSYEVAIRAKDLPNIQGYQFTLTYAQNLVELEGIEYGVAKADNFGIFKNKGAITTSWNLNSGVSAAGNEVLFILKLKAKANTKLSEVLKLSSQLTHAEAYDKENESIGVKLSFGAITSQDFAVLRQNKPNPFSDETSIGFYLPKATKGILSIRDSKGSLIYRVDGTYSKGENKIVLKQAELRASGVLYYTLETADFVDTKKMILLNP
jgi:hypothetical protein